MPQGNYDGDTGQLERIKAILRGSNPPPAPAPQPGAKPAPGAQPQPGAQPGAAPIPPSSSQQSYQGKAFALNYPSNWKSSGDQNQGSVTFAPADGLVQTQGGGGAIARGAVASMIATQRGQRVDLARDTSRLIEQLKQSNPSMRSSERPARQSKVDGYDALITTLYSQSPLAGQTEIDMLVTVARPDGLHYIVFIAPQQEFPQHQKTFESILGSVKFTR